MGNLACIAPDRANGAYRDVGLALWAFWNACRQATRSTISPNSPPTGTLTSWRRCQLNRCIVTNIQRDLADRAVRGSEAQPAKSSLPAELNACSHLRRFRVGITVLPLLTRSRLVDSRNNKLKQRRLDLPFALLLDHKSRATDSFSGPISYNVSCKPYTAQAAGQVRRLSTSTCFRGRLSAMVDRFSSPLITPKELRHHQSWSTLCSV